MVDNPPPPRTRAGVWLMAAPLIFVGAIAAAFGALVLMVRMGGEADGERVSVMVQTDCAEASLPVVSARISAMGLGDPVTQAVDTGLSLTITLPVGETDNRRIPETLTQQGEVVIRSAEGEAIVSSAHITGAGVEIDNAGMPTTLVQFDDVAKYALRQAIGTGPVTVEMDGQVMGEHPRLPDLDDGYLELVSGEGPTAGRMRVAADRSILIASGPLPCRARIAQVLPAH